VFGSPTSDNFLREGEEGGKGRGILYLIPLEIVEEKEKEGTPVGESSAYIHSPSSKWEKKRKREKRRGGKGNLGGATPSNFL